MFATLHTAHSFGVRGQLAQLLRLQSITRKDDFSNDFDILEQ